MFLSTAHPCKFPDVFPESIATKVEVPEQVADLQEKDKQVTALGKDFEEFKRYLLENE